MTAILPLWLRPADSHIAQSGTIAYQFAAPVCDNGTVTVRYLAQLRWRGLRIGYEGMLHSASGQTQTRWRLGSIELPQAHAGGADWPAPRHQAAALHYVAQCTGKEETLHPTPAGARLLWHPVVLNGIVQRPGATPVRGYVKRLRMNFAPWELGLRRLRWDRFRGQRHSLAWIVWKGALPQALAWVLLGTGLVLMAVAMWRLWRQGGGLPMNACPTRRRVSHGLYAWLPHPIYAGFVLAVGATAALLQSPCGFWVVAPLCALGAIALVWGYEGPAMQKRLGALPPLPQRLALLERLRSVWLVLAVWAGLCALFSSLPAPGGAVALRGAWEHALPLPEWALWLYSLGYAFAVAAPLCVPDRTLLLRWRRAAWCMVLAGFGCMLLWPAQVPLLQGDYSVPGQHLLAWNRALDADWLACPSFHTAWAVLAALLLGQACAAWRWVWLALAAAIGAACVLTGSHASVDVLAGALLACAGWWAAALWRATLHAAERLANSWSCWQWRGWRVISHWIWSGLAAAVGMVLAAYLAGDAAASWATLVVLAGLLAAGAWGYWLEGGHRRARPFGYYGFLLGCLLALAVGLLAALCMRVDWPGSTRRFSRLTVVADAESNLK